MRFFFFIKEERVENVHLKQTMFTQSFLRADTGDMNE